MQGFLSHVNNSSLTSLKPLPLLLRTPMEMNTFGMILGRKGRLGSNSVLTERQQL